ncbi:MAG: GNAT family N-acetyltransferase [Tissierellia bacterium]|nr:GNAT family N-acetyltransferase [Tissierellia bacterium]
MYRLEGERIILREYRREDYPHIRRWVNDYEITQYLSNIFLYPHTEVDTEKFLNQMLEGKTRGFVIAHKDTEEYIGQLDLVNIDWPNRVGHIGIVIGSKEDLGKGYGTEAIKLIQDFAFNKLNLNKLELNVLSFNERARRCYEKCGFKVEGVIRQNFYKDGKYVDTIKMGILRAEWEEAR